MNKWIRYWKLDIRHCEKAFSLVEVLLAGAVFSIITMALFGALITGQNSTRTSGERVRASFIAEEGLEAVRNMRDGSFADLADGTYGLVQSGNQWTLSGTSDVVGSFTRAVQIGTVDADTKSAIATVTWQQTLQRAGSISLETRFTNWLVPKPSTIGDWANAVISGSVDISGITDALKIATQGDYAYVVMNGGSPEFLVFDISNVDAPTQIASLSLSSVTQDVEVSGNYAYVASTANSAELMIIDISTPASPVQVSSFDAPGNTDGNAVALNGDTAYLVRKSGGSDEFIAINITVKTAPTFLGSYNLGSSANEVKVLGNYAYVASDNNSQELQVVNVAVPTSLSLVGSYDIPSNDNGETVTVFGSTVIVGTLGSGDLCVFDVSTPSTPVQVGFYDGGDDIRDIALGNNNNYAFLATDANSAEFQVVDITTLTAPVLLGSVDVTGSNDLNGLAYHATKDRVYAVGDSNSEEVIVIKPQ